MKKKSASQSGLFNPRTSLALILCSAGFILTIFSFAGTSLRSNHPAEIPRRYMPVPDGKIDDLDRIEQEWHNRVTYPTGVFNPAWIRNAAEHDARIGGRFPAGGRTMNPLRGKNAPFSLDLTAFTALGPQPE